jgi:hypothetical protein
VLPGQSGHSIAGLKIRELGEAFVSSKARIRPAESGKCCARLLGVVERRRLVAEHDVRTNLLPRGTAGAAWGRARLSVDICGTGSIGCVDVLDSRTNLFG